MNSRFACIQSEQLEQAVAAKTWVWDGYVGAGQITLFTSVWKSGKTTLIAHLLARRKAGGTLAGRTIRAGSSVVVSEEFRERWHERNQRLGFGPGDCFLFRPFVSHPTLADSLELIDYMKELRQTRGVDLVIIDPLSYFLPAGAESQPVLLQDLLAALRTLSQQGVAVLLVHHPCKTRTTEGMLSRGSGLLSLSVDILIEMYRAKIGDIDDRRRRLIAFSRESATPGSLLIELNADGSDYAVVEEVAEEPDFVPNWPALRLILESANEAMTRQQLRKAWPNSFPAPSSKSLWRWLNTALTRCLIARTGTGLRNDPFRYGLPERMDQFQQPAEAAPSATPAADAWLEEWSRFYPPPPDWQSAGDEDRDLEDDR